jgi:YD repeat-containing protein
MARVLTTTDQAGMVTTKIYDAVGRLSSVQDAIRPTPNVTNYFYDLTGNLRFVQDAAGRVTAYEYDPLNRRTTRTLPRSQFESYTYDPVGNLATKTDFNGLKTTYSYDTLNRLLTKTPQTGTAISHLHGDRPAPLDDGSERHYQLQLLRQPRPTEDQSRA